MITCSNGHRMVLRIATCGKNKGNYFYGCIKYPSCREIKSVEEASPEIIISAEMKKTLKMRYNKIIEQINKVWKKEKQKLILRYKLENAREEIKEGLRSNIIMNRSDSNMASAANILIARKKEKSIKADMEELQKKQLEELKEIEDNIIRI